MVIKVEFNPDLALRNIAEFEKGNREIEECIPENLEVGKEYPFFKKEQRLYWFYGEIPLRETQGNQILSKLKASVFYCGGDSLFKRWRSLRKREV
jgi:hypothetical protein